MEKTKILDDVHDFMNYCPTNSLSTSGFIAKYMIWKYGDFNLELFLNINIESISRSRRKIIELYPQHKRTKADTESEYILAFSNIAHP